MRKYSQAKAKAEAEEDKEAESESKWQSLGEEEDTEDEDNDDFHDDDGENNEGAVMAGPFEPANFEFLVDVEVEQSQQPQRPSYRRFVVPARKLLRLNQAHELPFEGADSDSHLRLEDGIKVRYSDPLTRAKMCEIALEIAAAAV